MAESEVQSPAKRTSRREPEGRSAGSRWLVGGTVVLAIAILWWLGPGTTPPEDQHIGAWSVLPALVTIVLAFVLKDVLIALFAGIAVGGIVAGQWNLLDAFILEEIGTRSYALILVVYLWALGGMLGLWTRTGGAQAFAVWAGGKIVRGPRSARFFAWMMGMIFHQGGTISTILAGTTVRPVTDVQNISHEELTYLIDSTASPAATVIPFNAWPLYVAGLVVGTVAILPTEAAAVSFFFASIPFNFYGIFAVLTTLLFALGVRFLFFGRMREARDRARDTGYLDRPGSEPLVSDEITEVRVEKGYRSGVEDFLLPMGVLLGVAIVPFAVARLQGEAGTVYIAEAFGLAVLTAFVLAMAKGMGLRQAMDGFIDGCKGVTIGAIILGLAVTLGGVSGALGTAAYIVEISTGVVPPVLLPAILMAVCMAVAFSIGSSWGTYAVVFPLALPLAWALAEGNVMFLHVCFGAVLGGAVFGDQCSPISDTTILSSLACSADVMDHVTTQIPLALIAAALAAVMSTVLAGIAL